MPAAQLGGRVVLIEHGEMGGECLNTGCVSSDALLAAARTAHAMRSAGGFGIVAVVQRAVAQSRRHCSNGCTPRWGISVP